MIKPNNNDVYFLTKTLKDYTKELTKIFNTTIDNKALPYLAQELAREIKIKNNHRFFGTKEENNIRIMIDNNITISSKTVPSGLYENCFNLNIRNNQEENKQVLFIETKNHNYILSNNGLFKFGKDNDNSIYNYYTFNENGEIERAMAVNHNQGILIEGNETWKFNTEPERNRVKLIPNHVYKEEELIVKLLKPRKISKDLNNKPQVSQTPKNNEDSIISIQHPKDNSLKLLALSTGIEGENYGEKAANYTIKTLKEWFINLDKDILTNPYSLQAKLYETILKINYQLRKSRIKVSSTLNCAIVTPNNTIIINIGSSKCYLIKDTNLKEITNDNSLSYGIENEELQASNESNNYKIDKGLGLQDSLSSYTARPRLIGNNSYDKLIFITNGTNNCLDDTKVKFIASTPNQSEILKAIVDETVDNQTVTTYPTENILTKK